MVISQGVGIFDIHPFHGAVAFHTQVPIPEPPLHRGVHLYEPGRPLSTDPTDPNPRELSPGSAGLGVVLAAGGDWLVYRTPDGVDHLYDGRLPFSASNPSVWSPALPADAIWRSMDIADGWLIHTVYRSTAGRSDLFVFDLEDDRNPVPVYTASGVSASAGYPPAAKGSVSSAGLLWTVPDGSKVSFQPVPFGSPGPVDLGPGTSVLLSGDYAAILDGGRVYGFDTTRPVVAGQNPVDLGDYDRERPVLVGPRLAWPRGGQIYTADLSDPTPSALWISDTNFDHAHPTIGGGGVAWVQCDPGALDWPAACREGRFRGVAFWSSGASGPATVFHDRAETIGTISGSSVGLAWVEGPVAEEEIYFFAPDSPALPDVNPLQLTHNDTRDISPRLTADALYWWVPWRAQTMKSIDAATLSALAAGSP